MTSQLNVDTIVDKAGSGGTNIKIGSTATYETGSVNPVVSDSMVKFHCSYESGGSTGGAGALQSGSLNTSSVSDNGTGNFSPNFSSNFSGATYTVLGNFQIAQDSGAMRNAMSRSRATSNTKFLNYDQNGNLTESVMDYNMLSGLGDLA